MRYLILAAQREGNRQLGRQLAPHGLTVSQAEILTVLADFGPLSLRDLGSMIVCETGSPSRIVDALVQRDLVVRETDPRDRRALILELTAAGRELIPTLRAIDAGMDSATVNLVPPDQQCVIVEILRGFLAGTEGGNALERRFISRRGKRSDP
ncbi:MAG: MarR family winged helix-turn-helix transcriptional regulator [Rhodoglobus sp.]